MNNTRPIKLKGETMTKVKYGYKNKDGYILNINGFERLNGGKKLSRSQKALLGLKKVKITKDASGYTKEAV